MANNEILKSNVRMILRQKGWTQERLAMHMGWKSTATYAKKFTKEGKWTLTEINRLIAWSGRDFEELFSKNI